MRSVWSVEMQSSAMFARPSPPSARGFAARPLDRPSGEGLVARLSLDWTTGLTQSSVKRHFQKLKMLIHSAVLPYVDRFGCGLQPRGTADNCTVARCTSLTTITTELTSGTVDNHSHSLPTMHPQFTVFSLATTTTKLLRFNTENCMT